MNIVRLGMILALGGIAVYALYIYANMPVPPIIASEIQKTVTIQCPSLTKDYGIGVVFVALAAIAGAITVSAVDLFRRVY